MFRRLLWLTIGIVVGVLAWRRLTKVAQSYTPAGLTDRAAKGAERAGAQWRSFVGDVRTLSAVREAQLREALATDERPGREAGGRHSGRRRGDGRELRPRQAPAAADIRPQSRHGD